MCIIMSHRVSGKLTIKVCRPIFEIPRFRPPDNSELNFSRDAKPPKIHEYPLKSPWDHSGRLMRLKIVIHAGSMRGHRRKTQ
ncbi:Uncharacterized protein HZ326_15566 [Fusarium oxysporum f. sp. albedinis]|nr:Uncharacterized protein HZ326_15566 [Fusarium oxysporum f. sp. albedinis]